MTGPMDPMTRLESGGNPRAVNRRTGATGLRQFMPSALEAAGVYRRGGPDGWGGVFNIPSHPNVRTREDFMASPEAQEATNAHHRANLRGEIARRGLTRFVGQTVAGRPIDEETIIRGMHFAGPTGMSRFLETGGQHNPSDGNLRVDQYLARTAGEAGPQYVSVRAQAPPAAAPALAPAPSAGGAPKGMPRYGQPMAGQGSAANWQDLLLLLGGSAAAMGMSRLFR